MSMSLIVIIISIVDNYKMDKDYLQKFALHLKNLRSEKGIKQDDFLGIKGISRSTIAMIETAKTDVTLSKIKIIAKVLKVHPKDLLDFEE